MMMKLTEKQKQAMRLFREFAEVMPGQRSSGKTATAGTLRSLQKRGLLSAVHRQEPLGWWNWHYRLTDAGREWLQAQESAQDE